MDEGVEINNEISFNGDCNLCGKTDTVYDIFKTTYEDHSTFSKMFEECMSLKISPNDLCFVCHSCLEEAIDTLNFKNTWDNSHSSLSKYFESFNKTNNVNHTGDGRDWVDPKPDNLAGLYPCSLCCKPFFSLKNLQHHMVLHIHSTQCRICKLECYETNILKKHYNEHMKNKVRVCNWCGGSVVNGFHDFDKSIDCPVCNFNYPCNLFLQNHIAVEHPEHMYRNKTTLVMRNKLTDVFQDLDDDANNSSTALANEWNKIVEYKCSECNKIFNTMEKLESHLSLLKCVYVCDICGMSYKLKTQLRVHMMDKHLGVRPHLCYFCGKSFVRRGMLKSHQQVHTKERSFQCHECGNKFVSAATLRYHSRLHTGEKPYVCFICGQGFVKCSRLREHEQRAHIGKLQCPVCLTTFSQRCSLKTHMDRFHPNIYERNQSYLMTINHGEKLEDIQPTNDDSYTIHIFQDKQEY